MPRKNPGIEREPKHEAPRWTMKARSDWSEFTSVDDFGEAHVSPQHIDPAEIPEGFDMRWVTDSVYGKPFAEWRANAERNGWAPVNPEDFDHQFDGRWAPKGAQGECRVEGQVLMARPLHLSQRAKVKDNRAALEQVFIKEQALTGGNMKGVSLDTTHKSALQSNRINKSYERVSIPED